MAHIATLLPSQASMGWAIVQPIIAPSAGTASATSRGLITTTTATALMPATTMSNRDRTGFDVDDPLFRRLMVAVLYSRNLIQAFYYLVFLGLAVCAAVNGFAKICQWHQSKRADLLVSSSDSRWIRTSQQNGFTSFQHNSSGKHHTVTFSSGNSSPTSSSFDSELLPKQSPFDKASLAPDQNRYSRCSAVRTRAWLMSQPERSLLGRAMPSNSVTVLIIVGFLTNVGYLLYNIDLSVEMLFVLADRAAILFAANLPILYLLSAKNQPLQQIIGHSYASLNIFHRRLGEWMVFLACAHGSLMFTVWAVTLRPRGYDFAKFVTDRVTYLGLCALICFGSIFSVSLNRIRHISYEFFLVSHVLLQLGGLSFLYFHHSRSRLHVMSSLCIWSIDRIWYRWISRSQTLKASFETMPDERTVKVKVIVPLSSSNLLRRILGLNTVRAGWKALDHAFLSIPSLGGTYLFQSHPFSIATKAAGPGNRGAELGFLIRARDGFTRDLLTFAQQHSSALVNIDGPYGTRSGLRMLQRSQTRLLVAGGSGIAVVWPLIHALMEHTADQTYDLEYARASGTLQPIYLIWIIHDHKQYDWVERSQLAALKDTFGVTVILPPPTSQAGRPDVGGIIEDCVMAMPVMEKVGILCSGPDSMARDVRNGCARLTRLGRCVEVEVEKYGW